MGSGSPRWTTSLAETGASGAVLWDVGTVRWLRLVDPERRVRRAGRHDEQRLNDERHGALIPERAHVLHGQEEAGAGGGVDRPQRRGDLLAVAVVDVAQRGADQVHDAGLDPRLRERRLDRLGEALQPVDAADQDVIDAAAA